MEKSESIPKTPSGGLQLLETLHCLYPNNQGVTNGLINAYIKLSYEGHHDKALALIDNIPDDKTNIQNLKFKAWYAYKNKDTTTEKKIWERILSIHYIPQIDAYVDTLLKRSENTINLKDNDIILICVERNEILRLPYFLQYYRNLGITQFFFVDNNSDDGSFEYLLKQSDCHVFWTNDSYTKAGLGVAWTHHLINNYLNDQWYIIADADELLIYPHCENNKLDVLTFYLNQKNVETMSAFMLDMFPDNTGCGQSYNTLLQQSPFFYNNYQWFSQTASPYNQIGGGIRNLLFNENTCFFIKTGIATATKNIQYTTSTHSSTPSIVADITAVFLHFKFVGDAQKYFKIELKRKEHSGGALRYQQYNKFFQNQSGFDIAQLPKTTKYQNSQQLVDLGLIRSSTDWESVIANVKEKVNE